MPRLADDKDASGAHEQAVRDLAIDFPAELAAIEAKPFDADLVWNRMNKGLILGAAAAALGDEWAAKHDGLKKKDLVAAAAEAFRHDPARDAAVDAAATRWLPPGFDPLETNDDNGKPRADAGDDAGADPEPATGDETTDAPTDAAAPGDEPPAAGTDGNGSLPAFLTS